MDRLRPYPVAVFCAVTLFIWGNRIWLAWTNTTDTVAEKLLYSVPITAFVVAAVVLLIALLRGADQSAVWFLTVVRAFAAGTIVYWAVRAPLILLADRSIGFKVVHALLAVASVAAAAFAWRAVRAARLPSGPAAFAPRAETST